MLLNKEKTKFNEIANPQMTIFLEWLHPINFPFTLIVT